MPRRHLKSKILTVLKNLVDMKSFTKAAKASKHKTLSGWINHTLRKATQICPS